MSSAQTNIEELQKLEGAADTLLSEIAGSLHPVSPNKLRELENIAARAAKIAYGTGNATLLSEQMRNLIAWTDHLNETDWVEQFWLALATQPLISPWR
jgi:hypothetical protein